MVECFFLCLNVDRNVVFVSKGMFLCFSFCFYDIAFFYYTKTNKSRGHKQKSKVYPLKV